MKTIDRTLTFFRVFDLAFFAPGVLLAGTCLFLSRQFLVDLNVSLSQSGGILLVLGGIGAIYSAGLMTHSITWAALRIARRLLRLVRGIWPKAEHDTEPDWPPWPLLFEDSLRDELILYFWYLRATCWNLASAVVLSTFLVLRIHGIMFEIIVGALGVSTILVAQGSDFNRAVNRCLETMSRSRVAVDEGPRT